jgi:probable HAF family extracellular repeat protein
VFGSNTVGDVVGWFDDATGKTHGFVRIMPGKHVVLRVFDMPKGRGISPNGINNLGEIVGSFTDDNNVLHGFLRSDDGTFTVIDIPGAINTSAWGINDDDAIVGRFSDADKKTHGFMLTHRRARRDCIRRSGTHEPGGACRRARVAVRPPGEI